MTFDDILAQVQALLQREQRLSYRALQRRFALEEADLEALKDELIYAKRLAVDEDNRVLVWVGDAGPTPAPVAQAPQSTMTQADHQTEQPIPHSLLAVVPPSPEAERRQLTILFCDLVSSTALSRQLDPEDYRAAVRAYQAACVPVIERFDGHIAQYLGDGLLVYFGYPLAHEDDAQRAVRAGLAMVEAMRALATRLEQQQGVRLTIRVGIHTGPVVVGEMGAGGRREQLALGETPNIAAHLESLAAPNTVVISAALHQLVQGYFVCDDLGAPALKGVDTPFQVYRVVAASGAQSRLDVASPRGLTPLVGREAEVTLLLDRWAQVKEGLGQVSLLSGEAGIGKSRLVQVLKEYLAGEPYTLLECRSSPYHTNSALYPVIDLWQRELRFETTAAPADKLQKPEQMLAQFRLPLAETVPLFAALLSLPDDRYPALALTPQQQKQKTLEALLALLVARAVREPLLLIVEDLHWVDPSTLEFLSLLVEQGPTTRILTLCMFRPQFTPPWPLRAHIAQLTLTRLPRPQVGRMVMAVAGGKALPAEVVQQVVTKSDGVPLFVEEMTKLVLVSGLLQEHEDYYTLTSPLPPLAIPATLQDALMARLGQLATAKVVAQLGATIGREFTYALPQATYLFKHALLQDAAYQSLLRSTRRQIHQRTAQVLAEQFPNLAETQPELLAHHYTEAGLAEQGVEYWQRAGERSNTQSAYVEAVAHLTKGLDVLQTLQDSPARALRELTMQRALERALQTSKGLGAPERGKALARIYELCWQVENTPQLVDVLGGLASWHRERGEIPIAQEAAEQRLTLAQRQSDVTLLMQAHRGLGGELFFGGVFAPAYDHLKQAITLATRQQDSQGAGSANVPFFMEGCQVMLGRILWMLGYPDQALTQFHQALALVQKLAHPGQLATVLVLMAWHHWKRREPAAALAPAEAALVLATEQGFGQAMLVRGWALAAQGRGTEGLAELRQGLAHREAIGAVAGRAMDPILLAETYGRTGQMEEGLHVLAEMRVAVDNSGLCFLEAEMYRLTGELQLQQAVPNEPQAEAGFQQALDVARRQQAKSWELRAATSLSRLWQRQGKRDEARELLAEVYDWFTEGFDTADLQDARALLDELA